MPDPITFFNFEYIYQLIYYLLTGEKDFAFLSSIWATVIWIAYFLVLLFVVGIIYTMIRLNKIRKEESEILYILTEQALNKTASNVNPRWFKVMEHVNSSNENDWRLAIIEADLMLDDLLKIMGRNELSIGDKLKLIEKSDFNTIDMAWEAHKVRNKIAHEGSQFILTRQEARRVVGLYKTVFDEFEYV